MLWRSRASDESGGEPLTIPRKRTRRRRVFCTFWALEGSQRAGLGESTEAILRSATARRFPAGLFGGPLRPRYTAGLAHRHPSEATRAMSHVENLELREPA